MQRESHELGETDPAAGRGDGVPDQCSEAGAVRRGVGRRRRQMGKVGGKQALNLP